MRIILSSASPRRQELLKQIGVDPLIRPVEIDETPRKGEAPLPYVERMAREKLASAKERLIAEFGRLDNCIIITCDTSVVVDQEILGKPNDYADFIRMMSTLSGRSHQVISTVAMTGQGDAITDDSSSLLRDELMSVETEVTFRELDEAELAAYWRTGEPCDKAGGYGIQGLGAVFVREVKGSYSNVVGLPLQEVFLALRSRGYKTVI